MKVLKPGNPQGTWSQEMTCTGAGNGNAGCGALLEVVAADLFHTQSSFCGRDTTDYVTIECPDCKVWTDMTPREKINLPQGIRSKVMGYKLSSTGNTPIRATQAEYDNQRS